MQSDYNGQDFTRPQQTLGANFVFRESGPSDDRTNRGTLQLKGTTKFDLGQGWRVGVMGEFDVVRKETTSPASSSLESGAGDTTLQVALLHDIDARWAYGFGGRFVLPTAGRTLGSGQAQAMPAAGVRYTLIGINSNTYFAPVVRYAFGLRSDPTQRRISEPQIAPTLNIGLPDRWFVTLFPSNDIRINYGAPIAHQTGRLFLPFDAAIGRKLENGLVVTLEASVPIVKNYPVYNFKSELKLSYQF